ncbi:LruC domain-containing protein [Telluribacter humicola]|uniref:LruC domain-containing protein n=1 Tax=Telluribacter humicola TaxID=1720261 RepID=UPI001A96D55E|nr:LruC domain-containing protein [Telluribacter humicola]
MKLLLKQGAILALLFSVYGCIPENLDPTKSGDTGAIENLKISETFNFKSTKDIQLNIKVGGSSATDERFRVNVYNDLPTVGQLLSSGITSSSQDLKMQFQIPASLGELYIEKINQNGSSEIRKVSTDSYISADFRTATPTVALRLQANSGMDCTTGCTKTYNNYTSDLNVNSGEQICLTGTFNRTINMNGGTVRICGTATNININLNNNSCKVYFLEGSTVSVGSINTNASEATIYNYSQNLSFNSSFAIGGRMENYGKMEVKGDLNLNSNSTSSYLLNNGEITATKLNNSRILTNNNAITVEEFTANSGSTSTNNCKLIATKKFIVNAGTTFTNNAYVSAGVETRLNSTGKLVLANGALHSTKDMYYDGVLSGSGTTKSVMKVSGRTAINSSASMNGTISYCDGNGIEQNNSSIASSYFSCVGTYLPTTSCNPEGFGTPPISTIIDTDKDGVADAQDDYPTDPTRAYNTYYPSATGWATYGFEDLWPAQGDYDFNDLIINSRITRVFNADNKLVELKNKIVIRAIGAAYENGFGFQLDGVSSSEVASVTGYSHTKGYVQLAPNKTEAGQLKAVIVAYESPEPLIKRSGGSMFNTVKDNPAGTPGQLDLVVRFASPLDAAKASQEKINPFIIVDGKREVEVHLANFAPTAKASTSLLGTLKDTSKPGIGRYYRTDGNLPWAIELPVEFNYPAEQVPITAAYLFFADWAQSGGKLRTDWYENKTGYSNNQKTFK